MDDTTAATGQVTTTAARIYEDFFVPALFGQWTTTMLDRAGVGHGHVVLDVGCGTGVLARAAVERVGAPGHVVGVDPNEGMLAVAAGAGGEVTWHEGRAEALDLDDAAFDAVVSQFALMFFTDPHTALREMRRVLRPGGTLAVATWASLHTTPGYEAMVALVDDVVGPAAAEALTAPFSIGEPDTLAELVAASFPDVVVTVHEGTARFPSIDAWVHTDVRGWTLDGMLDDTQYDRLRDAAHREMQRFTLPDRSVAFPAPALIATAT